MTRTRGYVSLEMVVSCGLTWFPSSYYCPTLCFLIVVIALGIYCDRVNISRFYWAKNRAFKYRRRRNRRKKQGRRHPNSRGEKVERRKLEGHCWIIEIDKIPIHRLFIDISHVKHHDLTDIILLWVQNVWTFVTQRVSLLRFSVFLFFFERNSTRFKHLC